MSTLALNALESVRMLMPGMATAAGQPMAAANFGELVAEGLQQVNRKLMVSQHDLQALAVGEVQNLHQLMIRLEESQMAFQLAMQIRNRALESYQELMRMSV